MSVGLVGLKTETLSQAISLMINESFGRCNVSEGLGRATPNTSSETANLKPRNPHRTLNGTISGILAQRNPNVGT